jgi:hypothetical protein
VFWSHTRENERCPVCGKFLSSECVECEEQIGLRPGYSFEFDALFWMPHIQLSTVFKIALCFLHFYAAKSKRSG